MPLNANLCATAKNWNGVKGEGPVPGGWDDPPIAIALTVEAALFRYWKEVGAWFFGHTVGAFHLCSHVKSGRASDAMGYKVEFTHDIIPIFFNTSLAASRSFCVSPFIVRAFGGISARWNGTPLCSMCTAPM